MTFFWLPSLKELEKEATLNQEKLNERLAVASVGETEDDDKSSGSESSS